MYFPFVCVFLIKLAIFFAYYKNHLYYTNVKFNIKADNKTITKKNSKREEKWMCPEFCGNLVKNRVSK